MYKHFTYRLVKNIRTSGKTSHRASKRAKIKGCIDASLYYKISVADPLFILNILI